MCIPCAEVSLAGGAVKILFFAPHAAIWVHAFPEALIAETLAQSGHTIVYVSCGEALQKVCIPMNAFGLDHLSPLKARQEMCRRCGEHTQLIRTEFGLEGCDLAGLLEPADWETVEQLLAGLSPDTINACTIQGVPVGRLALYEPILNRKKTETEFAGDEWDEYLAWLRGAVVATIAGSRIIERERPDCVVVYNSFYSVNHVMCWLAKDRGIPHYFLHAGGNLSCRLQKLMVGRDEAYQYLRRLVDRWPQFSHRPCAPDILREITNHFLVLFGGQSVFSYSARASQEPFNVRERYGIGIDQKIVVATMSSNDERVAAKVIGVLPDTPRLLFPQQVDWIKWLIEFAAERPDIFLLIRVHPRDFPNKREGVKSEQARNLEALFRQLPNNVCVNWPSEHVSLYDLANEAAVFLNAWSSAGKEMSLLGLPVVIYAPELIYYPSELNYVGTTKEELIKRIDQALQDGWSFDKTRATYRWLALEYHYGLIDIADSYPLKEDGSSSVVQRLVKRVRRWGAPFYQQKHDCQNRSARLRSSEVVDSVFRLLAETPVDPKVGSAIPDISAKEEETALRLELVRVGKALFGTGTPHHSHTLAARLLGLG